MGMSTLVRITTLEVFEDEKVWSRERTMNSQPLAARQPYQLNQLMLTLCDGRSFFDLSSVVQLPIQVIM